MSIGHVTHTAPVEDAMVWVERVTYTIIAAVFVGAGHFVWGLL